MSGRQKSLSHYLYSGNWYFQMCATQLAHDEGIALRLPFCDWRTVVATRPLTALCAVLGNGHRDLQRTLLEYFTPGLSSLIGLQKVNFNAVGSAFAVEGSDAVLGPPRFDRFETIVPDFIRAKQSAGREIR